MRKTLIFWFSMLLATGAVTHAVAGEPTASKAAPRFSHPRDITNPWLPLASLKQDILEGKEGGKRLRVERTLKPQVRKSFQIGDQTVEALAMEDREFEGGKLSEVTLDYFAQADDGTVYYLGEDVDQYKNGNVVGHEGAWLLGKQTQTPGVIVPGQPKVGDRFQSEDVPGITTEDDEVISLSEMVRVPAGSYKNCLKVKEKLSDGGVEYKYYARGVGCVREVPEGGDVRLISHSANSPGQSATPAKGSAAFVPNPGLPQAQGPQDPLARVALGLVGADPGAEAYWMAAINDDRLSAHERQDLIEDLNEDGLSDPQHPSEEDLPVILNRMELIEALAPEAMDKVNQDAFAEAYKDLVNLAEVAMGGGKPVD